ncbi:hypothetical protein L1987_89081 [Smallanthus sonchifolius]|nr:hypothetical protein L1987_89081 [Smallanthus sonchifolius]
MSNGGGPSSIPKVRPRMKKTYLRRHDCCDQELLNIIETENQKMKKKDRDLWDKDSDRIGIINSTSAVPGAAERDALAVEAKKGIEVRLA